MKRELGRWLSFWCGGFEIHGGELAKSAGERECSRAVHGVGRERESEPRERERARENGRGWVKGGAGLECRIRGGRGRARWPACGGDRRSSVTEQVKQSRRGPSAAPSGLSARQGVTVTFAYLTSKQIGIN